jgi:hypothetical protein
MRIHSIPWQRHGSVQTDATWAMAGCLVTSLRANPIATQEHLGWERGCQLLAVLGAGTNELKGFAVTGMNRNLAGFEYYSNINTDPDDPATAARLMHAGWVEGSKGVASAKRL